MFQNDYNFMETTDCLQMPMYATIYMKFQKISDLYTPEEALENGTIFPELNMPYDFNQMQ